MTTQQPTRRQLIDWDHAHYWHAFTQMAEYEPFLIERAEGCYLIDIDGNRYLDGASSMWCNVHGHRHPRLDAALREQLDRVAHSTSLGSSNTTTIQLARRLAEISPGGLNHVFFSDSGSTAIEVALKMAFQYWQQRDDPRPNKTKYIALGDAYHGDTIGSVAVGGVARFHEMFAPLLCEVYRLPAPDTYRLPAGVTRENAASYYLGQAEELLRAHHREIAAFVIEPLVQGAAGMVMHPAGYLHGIRELTRKYDVLMIADEVAVGFGRTGRMFACEHEEVVPDFLCLAKGITGGYLPLAATVAGEEIYSAFLGSYEQSRTFYHGHTYGGNPLGAAVAIASLDLFEEEQILEKLQPKIVQLAGHLERLADHPHVGDARQCGLIAGIELVKDRQTAEPYDFREQRAMQVCKYALSQGVWLRPLGNVVVVIPPLAIEYEQLDHILGTITAGIDVATA